MRISPEVIWIERDHFWPPILDSPLTRPRSQWLQAALSGNAELLVVILALIKGVPVEVWIRPVGAVNPPIPWLGAEINCSDPPTIVVLGKLHRACPERSH